MCVSNLKHYQSHTYIYRYIYRYIYIYIYYKRLVISQRNELSSDQPYVTDKDVWSQSLVAVASNRQMNMAICLIHILRNSISTCNECG